MSGDRPEDTGNVNLNVPGWPATIVPVNKNQVSAALSTESTTIDSSPIDTCNILNTVALAAANRYLKVIL
jgi:hypothetical protein